ncbi:glycosyltransferase [Novosphingobium sp.]|uniref:glycosyltransferase n=1 Tax=Novosphingobium sp. TaxID=1874826 RepID=UPI002B480C7A|nr:glycosyltransferase [Novosphingobium sp.]HKR93167.1 glycosyltransferase [Novosphingobium sp.]
MRHNAIDVLSAPEDGHRFHGAGTVRVHPVPLRGKLALALFAVLTIAYFMVRFPLWNPEHPVLASLLLGAELFGTFTLVLHALSTWCLVERKAPQAHRFEADIFITTWNESVDILRHTLLAAKQVKHARHIWLLDDGNRAEMVALASELGVKYLTREDRSHAKAGNINNALAHTDAEFIALFDCDHAPSPEFLALTLGYFLDPSVAFVQTPQDFYNVDSFQHRVSSARQEVWHEQTLFYRVIEAGKDYWNSTFFCGSCAVLRREALADIGGIATGTITEDMHTSLRLHKHGWSAVYHVEALAFGLSPTDLEQYETQRLRWGRGAMQVWAKEGILFTRGLSLAQRLAYLTSAITYFEGWQKGVVYLMPIVVLLTGWMPIIWSGWSFLSLFTAWLASGVLVNEIFSRGYSKTIWMEEYNFLRFFTFMKATLALVLPIKWGFSVTPKNLASRSAFPIRLWPQVLVAAAAIASIPIGTALFETRHHLPFAGFLLNIMWASFSALLAIKAISFATDRSKQRRTDHRFIIPLIARLQGKDGAADVNVVAEDISSNGFGFWVDPGLPIGPEIDGEIQLPSGPLRVSGTVVGERIDALTGLRRVAVRLRWATASAADPLNACLYGNTLQWDINGWAETTASGWQNRLSRLVRKTDRKSRSWKLAHLENEDRAEIVCAVRQENDLYRIVATAPFPATGHLKLMTATETQDDLQVAGYRAYQVGGGTVHMGILNAEGGASSINSHRQPTWTRKAIPA